MGSFSSHKARAKTAIRAAHHPYRPRLEALEDRLAPASLTFMNDLFYASTLLSQDHFSLTPNLSVSDASGTASFTASNFTVISDTQVDLGSSGSITSKATSSGAVVDPGDYVGGPTSGLNVTITPDGADEQYGDPVDITFTATVNAVTADSGVGVVWISTSGTPPYLLIVQQVGGPVTETLDLNSTIGDSFVISITAGGARVTGTPYPPPDSFPAQATLSYQITPVNKPSVRVTSLNWDTSQGGVDYGYRVSEATVTQNTQEALYWSPIQFYDPSNATLIPGTTQTIPAGTPTGTYGPFNVSAAKLQLPPPPQGTKYLLDVTDPDNVLGDFDPSLNVKPLAVPDLVADSLDWHTTNVPIGPNFVPDQGGGVDLTYEITTCDLSAPANISFYWVQGTEFHRQDVADYKLAYQTQSQTTANSSILLHVSADHLQNIPSGANGANDDLNLFAVVDAPAAGNIYGTVVEWDQTNDVENLQADPDSLVSPVSSAGGEVRSVIAQATSIAMFAVFRPAGGALSLAQAAAIAGVDHFNWVQTITAVPDHWIVQRVYANQTTVPFFLDGIPYTKWYDADVGWPARVEVANTSINGPFELVAYPNGTPDSYVYYFNDLDQANTDVHGIGEATLSYELDFADTPRFKVSDFNQGKAGEAVSFLTQLAGVPAGFPAGLTPVLWVGDQSNFTWQANTVANTFNNEYFSTLPNDPGLPPVVDGGVLDVQYVKPAPASIFGRVSASGQIWGAVSNGSSAFTNSLWGVMSPAVTWRDVLTGDFNGDGKTDIVGRVLQDGDIWVGISTGSTFTFSRWTTWNPNVTWADVQVGDFTGDGKADIIGRVLQTGQWWVAQSTGSSFTNSLWATWNPNVTWADVKVGDFNGDGKADIAGRWLQGGSWWTGISTGSSFATSMWAQWNPNVTWVDVQVGDFNGAVNSITSDRIMDITGRWLQGGSWWTGISTGSSFSTTLWAQWNPNVTWADVRVGDFNGDGTDDITARWLQGGSWWTGLSAGSGFSTSLWAQWNPNVTWVDVQVGDFNGDGKSDITGRVLSTGQWWTAVSSGSAFSNSLWGSWSTAVNWVDVRSGDFA